MDATFIFSKANMRRAIFVALGTGAVVSSATAIGIAASTGGDPQYLGYQEYQAALRGIEARRDTMLMRCETLGALERDLCRTEAGASELVRVAEVETQYRHDQQSARALQRARIEARYQVERARCATVSGFQRDQCLVKVHATKGRALLEAAAPYEVRYTSP
jgi:hyperosmotically inducible protein